MSASGRGAPPREWKRPDGTVLACTEKVKVLSENWEEVRTLFQEVLDDAVLMGCTASQVKEEYKRLIDEIECSYSEQGGGGVGETPSD